jgi:hypothetical protein
MTKHYRDLVTWRVEEYADDWAKKYVLPAFQGDAAAASSLSVALSNDKRGEVARAMWQAKVPREAYRAYLASVWEHDHHHVIRAAGTRRRLACMFRYAAFPVPDHVPGTMQVWRGTSGLSLAQALTGYSWTTDRATACWFALRRGSDCGSPLVLTATVSKSQIVYMSNERQENEVVLMKPPGTAKLDSNVADWRAGYEKFERDKQYRQVQVLNASIAGAPGAVMLPELVE